MKNTKNKLVNLDTKVTKISNKALNHFIAEATLRPTVSFML